jgi:hypothetical protein
MLMSVALRRLEDAIEARHERTRERPSIASKIYPNGKAIHFTHIARRCIFQSIGVKGSRREYIE